LQRLAHVLLHFFVVKQPFSSLQHNKPGDLWIIIDSKVFDISKFAALHPGGENVLFDAEVGEFRRLLAHATTVPINPYASKLEQMQLRHSLVCTGMKFLRNPIMPAFKLASLKARVLRSPLAGQESCPPSRTANLPGCLPVSTAHIIMK
jgi:Cytochrome b5-like Heme/Steroid binding domain